MRILWLSHLVPYPPKGGVLQRAYYLLREISKYHDVDLLAFNQPDLIRPLFPSLEKGLKEARQVLQSFCRNVEFFAIPSDKNTLSKYQLALTSLFSKDPYTINWLKSEEYGETLARYIAANNYDLIHFDTISLAPYLKQVKGIAAVLDHHNIESHMLLRRAQNETNPLKKWYFNQEGKRLYKVEENFCSKYKLNITCSKIDRDRLRGIAPESRVEEVANGVDIDYFKPDNSVQQERSLIFIGTLSWYPNIEAVRFIANELWPVLTKEIPGICFDIIGANPPQDIIELSEKDKNFRVHGFVDDIHPFFNKAAVYVCPINDGGGTKLKILDALSMGKAVVAHPIACEGICVTEGEDVLFADNVDRYVEQIKSLIDDEHLRHKLGTAARHLIEKNYSYDAIGKQLSDLYQTCI